MTAQTLQQLTSVRGGSDDHHKCSAAVISCYLLALSGFCEALRLEMLLTGEALLLLISDWLSL